MIKFKTNHIQNIIDKFDYNEIDVLSSMTNRERKSYYNFAYKSNYRLSPSNYLIEKEERESYTPYVVIAERMNMSVSEVKQTIQTSLKKMNKYLQERNICFDKYL